MNEKILKNVDLDEEIKAIADNTAIDLEDVSVVDLSKEYVINGEKTKKLKFSFDKITGLDLLKAERMTRARKDSTPSVVYSMTYQLIIASFASGVPFETLQSLNGKDVVSVIAEVSDFLFN